MLDAPDMEAARRALGVREYPRADAKWTKRNIGFVDLASGTSAGLESDSVARWLSYLDLAGAVWTSLPCEFDAVTGSMPTSDQVPAYLASLVEMLFAHLKRILKLDRLRLRGISGARDEFLMAAAAQNLRRMARWLTPATV